MKKFVTLAALFLATPAPARAEIIAHKFAPASAKANIYNLQNLYIDLDTTNWIAWNTSPSLTGGLLGPGSVTPYMLTVVVNPSVQVDVKTFNDSSGPRAVLYGDASTTPDVVRVQGDTTVTYDEGGTYNNFNQSGIYEFEFKTGEEYLPTFHGDLWLLIDVNTDPPLPVLRYWGEEQLNNGGFAGGAIGKFEIASYGKWDGAASIVDGAAQFTEDGSLIQYVNVRHLASQINAGHVTAVSSVGGVYAHAGNPVPYQPVSTSLGGSTPVRVPQGSEFLQLKIDGLANQQVDDVSLRLYLDGDYNNDGVWTASDLDFLSEGIRQGSQDWRLDLSNNGVVTLEDRRRWIEDLVGSHFGDANLDKSFDSGDFVTVFQGGAYEAGTPAGWEAGDFSGDALFDSSDLTLALSLGAYEEGGAAAHAIPEPTNAALFFIILICCWRVARHAHNVRGVATSF